jgi:Polyketide cyclase / dehydrase and lipid transport
MIYVLIVIAVVIAALLVMGLMRPAKFSVIREAEYKAKPEAVFAQLNDFHKWAAWSPWEKMDPDMKRDFSGAASGEGAKYAWVGNKKVGEGNMEITRSVAPSNMELDLHFIKPFQADNVTEFTVIANGNMTNLKWEMRGQTPFMLRVMHMFFNMDKIVGKDFETGLANLRSIVEK